MKSSADNGHFLRILTQRACVDESRAVRNEAPAVCLWSTVENQQARVHSLCKYICWNRGVHTPCNTDSKHRSTSSNLHHYHLQYICSQLQPIIVKIRAGHCNINFTCFSLQKEIGVSNIQNETWPFNQLLCRKVWTEYHPWLFIIYFHLPMTLSVN